MTSVPAYTGACVLKAQRNVDFDFNTYWRGGGVIYTCSVDCDALELGQ